ncbi:MAG: hypothetical protein IH607_04920, partial [Firmicutes bacterium]|nr:hypothetical protein [Bacillota bacterium]
WTHSFGGGELNAGYSTGSYGATPYVQQDYPATGYDDVAQGIPEGPGGYYGNYGTPAAVPPMMQGMPGQQPYGAPGQDTLKGTPYQNVPQMEYGQSYGARQQPDFTRESKSDHSRQPAQQPDASNAERDDLGIPAFLRRPTKK